MRYVITTDNLDQTLALGQALGEVLTGGEVFQLTSDVGGGKTSFTKGIAQGMGLRADDIQSPSFTVSRIYRVHHALELHHFDFYRLETPGLLGAELQESLHDSRAVVVVEWSTIVESVLPARRVAVTIRATGENSREFGFEVPDELQKIGNVLQAWTQKV